MATGKCEAKRRLKQGTFTYKDTDGVSAGGTKNYTKSLLGYSVPSGYSSTIIGFRQFGTPYWSSLYTLNNSSTSGFQVKNYVGGFADKNGTMRFGPVFIKDDGTLVSG